MISEILIVNLTIAELFFTPIRMTESSLFMNFQ